MYVGCNGDTGMNLCEMKSAGDGRRHICDGYGNGTWCDGDMNVW